MFESSTRVGGRIENQDYFQLAETENGLITVVCDGMGGANGGGYASELAVNKIIENISTTKINDFKEAILTAISLANYEIFQESQINPALAGMGTTVTLLLLNKNSAMCFHVGDSRIYHFREGKILFRTNDHSRVFEMVRMGILTEEEARVSSESNIITRALGIKLDVEITVSEELPYKKGDRFLICTDGIWGAVPEPKLIDMVSLKKPIEEVVLQLTEDIDQIGIRNGGKHDNLTAILVEAQTDSVLSENKKNKQFTKKQHVLIIGVAALLLILVLLFLFLK